MTFQERLLLALSRAPTSMDYGVGQSAQTVDNALDLLEKEYADFGSLVSGKYVADFGCGSGHQSVALVKKYGCRVIGIESNGRTLKMARDLAQSHDVGEEKLSFCENASAMIKGTLDVVISQNSFEHFPDPSSILGEMRSLIADNGRILITFGPPWLAPYGSHMHFFCKVPWVNVLFSEDAVMKVRSRFRSDGATRYEDVESGLNKMTISKFERTVRNNNGLTIEWKRYRGVKRADLLTTVPLLREFFVNHVSVVLSKAQ